MQNRPLAAAGVILLGMAVIGLIDQFIRVIAQQNSLWSFHVMRTVMIWAIALPVVYFLRLRLRPVNWRGVIGRSALMSTGMIIYFGTLAFLPVAQVAAALFTAPLWVILFSVVLFGLKIGPWRIVAVVLGFVGILLVLNPDPTQISPYVFIPVLAGAFYAMAMIATREWCPEETSLTLAMGIFTAMAVWGVLGLAFVAIVQPDVAIAEKGFLSRGWVWPTPVVLGWIAVQAVGSLVAVVLLTKGYQYAEASYAAVFEYSLLIFSALFGYIIWNETLTFTSGIGMVAIAIAGGIIAFRGREIEA